MKTVETLSYPVSIFVAGDYFKAREVCRSYCDGLGLFVTVTPTDYVYTGRRTAPCEARKREIAPKPIGRMGMDDLLKLAERCEAATGPDYSLDRAIADYMEANGAISVGEIIPRYSASLDAAMTLVPEWAKLHFLQDTEYDNPAEKTWSANLRAREWKERPPGFGTEWQAWCATPALALCAASLRAQANG